MLTTDTIQTSLNNANYKLAQSVSTDLNLMYGACQPKDWGANMRFKCLIKGLQYQLNRNDFSSDLSYSLYNKVVGCAGMTGTIPSVDPNAQVPNQTIVYIPVMTSFNSDKILFTTTTGTPNYTINYQTDTVPGTNQTFAQRYGNNPSLAIVINSGGYVGDEQTPPKYLYTNNNPAQPLISLTWQYPVATNGYLSISGVPTI